MGVPNPEGWQRVAGGRSVAETSGSARIVPRIPEGCRRSATPAGSVRISRPPFGGIAPAFASLRRGESLNPRLPYGKPLACAGSSLRTSRTASASGAMASVRHARSPRRAVTKPHC